MPWRERRRQDKIEMDVKEVGFEDWDYINVVWIKGQWLDVLNKIMTFRFHTRRQMY